MNGTNNKGIPIQDDEALKLIKKSFDSIVTRIDF
jgi:hypothetical protein